MLMYQRGSFQEIFLYCFRRCFAQARLCSWAGTDCSVPKPGSFAALTAPAAHHLSCLWLKACDGVSGTTYTTWGGICSFSSFYGNPTPSSPWISRGGPVPMPVPCFVLGSRVVLALPLLVISIWGFRVKGADTVVLGLLFLHLFPSLGSAILSLSLNNLTQACSLLWRFCEVAPSGLQGWV